MTTIDERSEANRLLTGLEHGTMSPEDAALVAEDLDPVLVYVIVEFLRAVYPASDPAATPVLDRVVRMTSSSAEVVRLHGEGEQDPVSRWVESEYAYRDYRGRGDELIELVVDKLES
jgi:hypothetical protein